MKVNIDHINLTLSEILFDARDEFIYPEFALSIHELMLTNKNWSDIEEIERVIRKLRSDNSELNYENVSNEYNNKKQSDLYEFSIPVEYPLSTSIQLNNINITLESNELEEKINKIKAANNGSKFIPVVIDNLIAKREILLTFSLHENNYRKAYQTFENTHALLRGIFEYSYSNWHFRDSVTFFYPRFILEVGNGFMNIQTPPIYTSSCSKHRDEHIHRIELKRLLKYFTSEDYKNKMYQFLSDIFRLYGLGKDAITSREKFLMFWNVLEKLMEPVVQTGNTNQIIKRANLFQYPGFRNYKYILKHLAAIRNDLVHRGIDKVEDIYIGYLNLITQNIIDFIFNNLKAIDSPEKLETFLLFSTIPYSDMSDNFELIKKLLKK